MRKKIRWSMRDRDSYYKLAGIIGIDDAFFGGPIEGGDKPGRGSSKTTVIVEASAHDETVVGHVDGETIEALIKADIRENQIVKTVWHAYHIMSKIDHDHQREIEKDKRPMR